MKRIVSTILTAVLCFSAVAQVRSAVLRADESEPLKSSVWGIIAVDGHGKTFADHNSMRRMLPASNMKLITTGAALNELGGDYRFETKLAYSGKIIGEVLHGDVYIIGGGDPTLAADDSTATPADKLFARWKFFLEKAGIKKIEGRIIGDGRLFSDEFENGSWEYDDLGTYYGAGTNGLTFYVNAQDFHAAPGTAVGEPATVRPVYPSTPWMKFANYGITGPAGTGDNLYLFTNDIAPYSEMRGTFAIDRQPRTEHCANKFPAMTCAYYFTEYLKARGTEVTGGYADIDRKGNIRSFTEHEEETAAESPEALTVLGSTFSAALSEIIRETNYRSDNIYAETLLRTLSLKRTGSAMYDSCHVAIFKAIDALGIKDKSGFSPMDGSGLSRQNYVSPAFMVEFLKAMQGSPEFHDYLISLPSPGKGTLASLLRNAEPAVKSRIFIKSGSMGGVLCYSGYIIASNGKPEDTIVFSLLTNNSTASIAAVRTSIEKIILELARQN